MKKSEKNEINDFTKKDTLHDTIGKDYKEQHQFSKPYPIQLELYRAYANWVSGQLPPTLCNVSLKVQPGQLCAIVGPVGSGKSAIMHLILNELPLAAGTISIQQKYKDIYDEVEKSRSCCLNNTNLNISYASQVPWIFSGTVRENILFGQPFDQIRYDEVREILGNLKRLILLFSISYFHLTVSNLMAGNKSLCLKTRLSTIPTWRPDPCRRQRIDTLRRTKSTSQFGKSSL